MIKSNELRIGNALLCNGEIVPNIGWGVIQIIYYQNKGIHNKEVDSVKWEPIPLTPEILEHIGFVIEADEYYVFNGFKLWHPSERKAKPSFYHINSELLIYVDYVHQLQNLIFVLTGEELNIEL